MDSAFLQGRIDATEAIIIAYETAILAFSTSQIMSYTMDTGQSRTVVTRQNINSLTKELDALYLRLCSLEARLNGGGSTIARPAF